jgi:hypothetical protein
MTNATSRARLADAIHRFTHETDRFYLYPP